MNATAWFEEFKSAQGLARLCAEQAPRWISGLLLAGLAVQLALLITSDPAANAEPVLQPTPATPAPTAPNRTLELASILNAHLFGLAAASSASVSDAPQTSMPLVLAGVLAMPDPQQGMAIIGPNAGAARLYTIGAQLPGGVKLHSVYSDRVLLDRNGSVEALFLPKTLSSSTPIVQSAQPAAATAGQRLQTLAQGNQLIGGVLRMQPVLNQGKLTGYRLFPGARGSTAIFTELGLQSGDLITAVNGTLLDDADRAQEIVQTLSSASSATVTVTRNGQPLEVNLNLETVAARAEAAAAEAAAATPESGARGPPPGGPGAGFGGRFRGNRDRGPERAAAER
jgi:general secretion pathway protein C